MRRILPFALLFTAVALASVAVGRLVFPALSWNRDEVVYLWHLDVLRSGHFASADGGTASFFRPWLTAAVEGELFAQYTLGWPLVLLGSDTVFGTPRVGVVAGAVLAVFGVYVFARVATGDSGLAFASAAVFALCPAVLIQSGMYLGYLFTLGLGLLFVAAVLHAADRRSRGLAMAAGLLVGWVFMTRPLDAILWAGVAFGYALVVRLIDDRRRWRELVEPLVFVVVGALPLFAATLAYNLRVTGSPTEFPITAADPLDTLGFGLRRIMPGNFSVEYGLVQAVKGSARNALGVPMFLVGGWLGLIVAAVGAWIRRRERSTLLLILLGLAFPAGYAFFWGIFLTAPFARLTGPYYYLPGFAPLSVLIAAALRHAFERRRAVGAVLAAALLAVTVPQALGRFEVNREISDTHRPWAASTANVEGRALVFVEKSQYLLFINPFSSNGPLLDDRILYANDKGPLNLGLIERHPDRRALLQRSSVDPARLLDYDKVRKPEVSVVPIEIVAGTAVEVLLTADTPVPGGGRVASITAGAGSASQPLPASEGSATLRWVVASSASNAATPDALLVGSARFGSVTVTVGDVRHSFGYRRSGSKIEVLTPQRRERAEQQPDGTTTWVLVPETAGFSVEIRPL